MDDLHHRRSGRAAETRHQRAELIPRQRAQDQALAQPLATQLCQCVQQRLTAARSRVAVRTHEQDGRFVELAGEVNHELQRGWVGPLEVVQAHEQAAGGRRGDVQQDATDTLEQPVAVARRIASCASGRAHAGLNARRYQPTRDIGEQA